VKYETIERRGVEDRRIWKTPDGREAPCVCEMSTVPCAGVNQHLVCGTCGHCWIRPGVSEALTRECEQRAMAALEAT
jgi:hypothetical protein